MVECRDNHTPILCPRSPIGRDACLRSKMLGVRFPPWVPNYGLVKAGNYAPASVKEGCQQVGDILWVKDPPGKPNMKYDNKQIANELEAAANGDRYCGNALYVARDIPGLSMEEIALLNRYLDGSATDPALSYPFRDRMDLLDLAIKIRFIE